MPNLKHEVSGPRRVITGADVEEMNKEFHRCRVDCSCECGRVYIVKTWVEIKQYGPYFHMPCLCSKESTHA